MVVPPDIATGDVGWVVTEKSEASVPLMATNGVPVRLSGNAPVFSIVKVRTTEPDVNSVAPKSVWSAVEGVESSSAMFVLLPFRFISWAQLPPVM
ncbi:hypothetical protein FLAT13_00049 [Flavobacterium salmonis]|uniref:Uncharacterized protein n=1 Tax=Flavobacterium salmonis TaxID=2654844 RepID=A0A6V6YLX9_9FLAO|nr:hypothetical protein FLAT13_00049 [Flavobacterium salmonis]